VQGATAALFVRNFLNSRHLSDLPSHLLCATFGLIHRGMKRTPNRIARNKFDEDAADRRHRENPHGDKVREVSAAFAEN
jgi:enoyl-CoA hydratase